MTGDALTGTGLLAAAAAAQTGLDTGTPPPGSSEARFVAAMIARVRELARRDQALAPAIAAQESAIVGDHGAGSDMSAVIGGLRSGRLDGSDTLYQALYRLAVLRLQATKPEALTPADRG